MPLRKGYNACQGTRQRGIIPHGQKPGPKSSCCRLVPWPPNSGGVAAPLIYMKRSTVGRPGPGVGFAKGASLHRRVPVFYPGGAEPPPLPFNTWTKEITPAFCPFEGAPLLFICHSEGAPLLFICHSEGAYPFLVIPKEQGD